MDNQGQAPKKPPETPGEFLDLSAGSLVFRLAGDHNHVLGTSFVLCLDGEGRLLIVDEDGKYQKGRTYVELAAGWEPRQGGSWRKVG